MNTAKTFVMACALAIVSSVPTLGAEITIVPVSASGSHTISGSEIRLQGSGQLVVFEIQLSGWAPSNLRAYQAVLDPASYTSGASGTLTAAAQACVNNDNATCIATYGGACSLAGNLCAADADCAFPQFGEFCQGPLCDFPPGVGGSCAPGIILGGRDDYVFFSVANLPAVDLSTPTFRFASAATADAVPDPGVPQYAAAFAFNVPAGATGTFTIDFLGSPDSVMQDDAGMPILPLTITPARIVIECSNNADCNDNNACTDDVCTAGTCSSTPNFNGTLFCCNPADGTLTSLDDGNACTSGTCDAANGTVTQDPVAAGSTCGNPASGACDAQDTCNGSGICIDRFALGGTACGDPTATECDLADICDGLGSCQANLQPAGAACGNQIGTDCDLADTCDGTGMCVANIQPTGTTCGDPTATDCNSADTCDGAGICLLNLATPGLPCGNPVGTQCDNPDTCDATGVCLTNPILAGTACGNPGNSECDNPDSCDGAGLCESNNVADGSLCTDDGNECRDDVCMAGSCTHPLSVSGTLCGDPIATDCDLADSCDGAGACLTNVQPVGVACGDPTATDCDRSDSCNGAGTCLSNVEPIGSACGDPTSSDCNSADTCDGAGLCLANVAPSGLPCGNQVGNQCDNPDTCDGAGTCDGNFVLSGTACGNPSMSECDSPDACDGSGTCSTNHLTDGAMCTDDGNDCRDDVCLNGVCSHPLSLPGTSCGDPTQADCNDADVCDGAGTCLPGLAPISTPCGDPTNDACTAPDTCSALGVCLSNDFGNGAACDDGSFCTMSTTCIGGVCGGGTTLDCNDNLLCTTDVCNNVTQQCDNMLTVGTCLIAGVCFTEGQLDPANSCQMCDSLTNPTDWTLLPNGSVCDDGDICTDGDSCEPGAVCVGLVNPACNDDCVNGVEAFDGTNSSSNNNRGPDDDEASCQFESDNDVWFFYSATCSGLVQLNLDGSVFAPSNDTVLSVYDACGGTEIACDDDSGPGLLSSLAFTAVAGTSYPLRVAGFMANTGSITLNIATQDGCVIGGACVAAGTLNPANECEACIPSVNSTDWSPRSAGSVCGDPTKNECNSADSCDGAGTCEANHKADGALCFDDGNDCTNDTCMTGVCMHPAKSTGAACGDPTVAECDTADTCDGAGACLPNFAPSGFLCGSTTTSECDNADVCDGLGSCDANNQPDGLGCSDDGLDCTSDVCASGLCEHPSLPAGTACGDGGLTECDTPDTCDGTGMCLPNFVMSGTACGNPSDTGCDNPDTCNGIGSCQINFEPVGFACGDPTVTDCDAADTCDGAGVCLDRFEIAGLPCGDPSSTQCDNADTCDGTGACLTNFEPAGLACGDPSTSDCDNADRCDGIGLCGANNQPDGLTCTDDGVECTADVCDAGSCAHPPRPAGAACGDPRTFECDAADSCDGTGICLSNFVAAAIACGDPADTDCDNPDTCDGAGACASNFESSGFTCGNPAQTGCDRPDTCDGVGICLDNFEITGLPCGDPANTQCDDPDTCDGGGACRDNFVASGSACGDPSSTDCDNADQCDGVGACDVNNIADGTACTDEGNDCTSDACASGVCDHTILPAGTTCGSQVDSECDHPDLCDATGVCQTNFEPSGVVCGDPADSQCDHPDLCDGAGACDPQFEADGSVCDDTDICTDSDACQSGSCVSSPGATAPIVMAFGPRYLAVAPLPSTSATPVSLLVTSPAWPCLSRYVTISGRLSDTPFAQTPTQWGTVFVHDQDIVPNTTYNVQAECGTFLSAPGSATTSIWGDVVGPFEDPIWTAPDGSVDIIDVVATIDRFSGLPTAPPLEQVDVWPCVPDGVIDIVDIVQIIDAFEGMAYPCPDPCMP